MSRAHAASGRAGRRTAAIAAARRSRARSITRVVTGGLHHHAELQRWLPLVVLPPVLMADALLGDHDVALSWPGAAAAYVGCLPLLVRRTASFPVMAVLLVAGIVLVLWQLMPGTTVVAIPAWALFDLGRGRGIRQAAIALVAAPFCVVVSVLPFADGAGDVVSISLRNAAICELAIVVGLLVRRTREAHDQALTAAESQAARVADEERLRIAQDVHDVVAHAMVAINVQSGVAIHRLDRGDPEQVRAALQHIRRASGEALDDLRATLGVLRDPAVPAPVGPAGLEDLDPLAERLRAAGVDVTLDVGVLPDVPAAVGAAGYRVVQESLTNVLRHARASTADVRVRAAGGRLVIDVRDDGVGAAAGSGDRAPQGPAGTGSGVRGMHDRVEVLGGHLRSAPAEGSGSGWHVHATLPLAAP